MPRLACDKEPSAHRAELAEDRAVVLKAFITRVVACFGAGQVVDAVPKRRPEAVSLTVDASPIVFLYAGDDRVELALQSPAGLIEASCVCWSDAWAIPVLR